MTMKVDVDYVSAYCCFVNITNNNVINRLILKSPAVTPQVKTQNKRL